MIKICEDCHAPIDYRNIHDHSFTAPYGSTVAHYEGEEIEYVCKNGHGSNHYILVEFEVVYRYIRRFGITERIKDIFVVERI